MAETWVSFEKALSAGFVVRYLPWQFLKFDLFPQQITYVSQVIPQKLGQFQRPLARQAEFPHIWG